MYIPYICVHITNTRKNHSYPNYNPKQSEPLEPRANAATEPLPRQRGWRTANGRVNPQGSQRRGFPGPNPAMGPSGHEPCYGGGATQACNTTTNLTMKNQPTCPDPAGDFENIRYKTTHNKTESHTDIGRWRRQTQGRNRPQSYHREKHPSSHQKLHPEDHSQPSRSEQHHHLPSQTSPWQRSTKERPPAQLLGTLPQGIAQPPPGEEGKTLRKASV